MNHFGIPEHAIDTFESIHRLAVTVHDLAGSLTPFLHPNRFHHRSPLCVAIKAGHFNVCMNFELKRLRQDLADLPEGRIHTCHAGLVECVVPVFDQQKLIWIFFAGPMLPGSGLRTAVSMPRTSQKSPWPRTVELPPQVGEEQAQLILEHLRQLAARIRKWMDESKHYQFAPKLAIAAFSNSVALRETLIRRFIEENHDRPVTLPMLAKKLCLSEGRASHVVRQSCGKSFREMLVERRLHAAMELLRHSGMNVLEVALASGFEDVSYFHRLFRRRVGMTPAHYRIAGHS